MALNAPNTEVLQRTDLLFDLPPDEPSLPASRLRDDDIIRRAHEKEHPNYLMYVEGNKRVIFDHFLISSWQKTIEEVAQPNYTRGQPIIDVLGRARSVIQVQFRLVDSRTTILAEDPSEASGYIGSSVREFMRQYDKYFRGSALTKADAYAVLSVKGRRDYGYVTQFGFDRSSANDYDVNATMTFWSFYSEAGHVGKSLAQQLIAKTSTGTIGQIDSTEDSF